MMTTLILGNLLRLCCDGPKSADLATEYCVVPGAAFSWIDRFSEGSSYEVSEGELEKGAGRTLPAPRVQPVL